MGIEGDKNFLIGLTTGIRLTQKYVVLLYFYYREVGSW